MIMLPPLAKVWSLVPALKLLLAPQDLTPSSGHQPQQFSSLKKKKNSEVSTEMFSKHTGKETSGLGHLSVNVHTWESLYPERI